jgi:hypothetical protein
MTHRKQGLCLNVGDIKFFIFIVLAFIVFPIGMAHLLATLITP